MFAACLAFAEFMTGFSKGTWFELPTFVWALGGGVILRNILESVLKVDIFDRAIDVFGNASLSLYLAMALLSLKLWQLADLAGPLVVILGAQTLTMALYAAFVTFRVMGKITMRQYWQQVTVVSVWGYTNRRCKYAGDYQYVWSIA